MGYSSAEEFQPDALTRYVRNVDITFHWVGGADRFWFVRQASAGEQVVVVDAATGIQTDADPAVATQLQVRPEFPVSPDRSRTVVRRHHDLWLRYLADGREQRITFDGEPLFEYGDVDPSYDRRGVARRRAGEGAPLRGVHWSADGRFIVALRQDLRHLPNELFVTEFAPPDDPYAYAHFRRLSLASIAEPPSSHIVVFDTERSEARALRIDPQCLNNLALPYFVEGIHWWRGSDFYFLAANRDGSSVALLAANVETGEVREVLRETATFNVRLNPFDYAPPNVHVTADGSEVIWYSERSGHGHLYLHDAATGALVRALTRGEWVIFDLVRVDETEGFAYFTAASRSEGNPYYRYLYRVSLGGGDPQLLTPEVADHKFSNLLFLGAYRFAHDGADRPQPGSQFSPSGRFFVDSYSTTAEPPKYVLRDCSGTLIAEVLSSDARALYGIGWRPPERFVVKAADGATDLYGSITYPREFDPSRTYPVIDTMYPGPQGSFAARTFVDQIAGGSIHHLQAFADAGFIVVAVDGRGTAHRSRAFRDAFLGTEDVFGAADHVAALRELAASRPFMDIDRVGVRGQSFGGYGALRAALLFPSFFKVVVSSTGPGEYLHMAGAANIERFFGVPGASAEARAHYDLLSNTRLAARLQARTLLIYGGLDESVPLTQAFLVIDAFIAADKDIDVLIVPNADHSVSKEPYVIRRSVRYFLDHLASGTPTK